MDNEHPQVDNENTKYSIFSVSTYPQSIIIFLDYSFLLKNRLDNNKMLWTKHRVKSVPLHEKTFKPCKVCLFLYPSTATRA